MKLYRAYWLGLITIALLYGCNNNTQQDNHPQVTQKEVNEALIKSHQMYVKQEADEITQYIKRHNYSMQATTTGIYYMITEHGNGDQPQVNDMATVSYTISLLDGTICYDSKTEGPKEFKVGEDEVESGVHQAVQLMHVGDKGIFIIPSNLAQGLVGDRDKIPPGAVVIYDMTLISVKKGK